MSHGHHHHPDRYNRAFLVGIGLNLGFVFVETGFGLMSGSIALLSDAGHNLGDVFALLLAWGAFRLAKSRPSERRTYGMKRATVLASLISAVFLCVALGAVVWEAINRLKDPAAISGLTIIIVAGIGVIINTATAFMFMSGRKTDLNIKGAFLHMAADAAISLGVVCAGIAIMATGLTWIDPAMALMVAVAILVTGIDLLRESLDLAMDAVPRHIDLSEVRSYLAELPGVADVHDLHIWGMSTTETALTAHLVIPGGRVDDAFFLSVAENLQQRFSIQHPTIQIESGDSNKICAAPQNACCLINEA